VTDPSDYARQIETYLCQKNKGHLIRVVGPAFDLVCGWASSGVPLKVAFSGIDRCCDRHQARGPRRRPIRIEFCEADVLDAFDDWRRAVGVAGAPGDDNGEAPARKPSLASHIERAIARLAHTRGPGLPATALHRHIDEIIRELEGLTESATRARGEVRERMIGRLGELDASLLSAATGELDQRRTDELMSEAVAELAPFGSRMPADARQRAIQAAFQRLVREASALPTLAYQ
jgi:hypothetical protein